MPISKEDVKDGDFVDAAELASDGMVSYRTGLTVTSTTAATKRVVISGAVLNEPDVPLEVGDKVTLAGNAAAGTYTVASIVNTTTFAVIESIVDSTGGTAAFKHPSGASKVGFDPVGVPGTVATTLQGALKDVAVVASTGGGGSEVIVRTLAASLVVSAGTTRLQRDTVLPDGLEVAIQATGELLIL